MTNQQMEQQASLIRARWTRKETTFERIARESREREKAESPVTKTVTAEEYRANVTAKRPLGPQDVGMLLALEADKLMPPALQAKENRRVRSRLIRFIANPDLSGGESPEDWEWDMWPDLYERYIELQKHRR